MRTIRITKKTNDIRFISLQLNKFEPNYFELIKLMLNMIIILIEYKRHINIMAIVSKH